MASVESPFLLLLPAPPQPPTRTSLVAAYREPIAAVLSRLNESNNGQVVLVVAVACPILTGAVPRAKAVRWHTAQTLLSTLYTIISVLCAERSMATDVGAAAPSVDARVVLVDHDQARDYYPDHRGCFPANSTTVLDLAAFASRGNSWRTVFHPSSESGYELLSRYLNFAEGKQTFKQKQLVAVPGGLSMSTEADKQGAATETELIEDQEGYSSVCLGGTFDHLHPGHKLLLQATALLLKVPERDSGGHCQLIIGISGNDLLKNKKYASEMQTWSQRAESVVSFLYTCLVEPSPDLSAQTNPARSAAMDEEEIRVTLREGAILIRCVKIQDPFGPTITEQDIDAIAVSGETRSGGQAINDRRSQKDWGALDVYEVNVLDTVDLLLSPEAGRGSGPALVHADDFSAKISSTAIRKQRAEAKLKASK